MGMEKQLHIFFWVLFPFAILLLSAVLVFYLDLANGPMYLLFLTIGLLALLTVSSIILVNKKMRWRLIPWGAFAIGVALVLTLAKPAVEVKSAAYYDNPVYVENSLTLANGEVRGIYNEDNTVDIYAGIPYAEAPVGGLGWKDPQPVKDGEGVKDCSRFAARAMQNDGSAVMSSLVDIYAQKAWHPDFRMHPLQNMSEDCLYLNIWRPVEVDNAPILVFIHGGSLESGSAAFEAYNGEAMAKKGVIMITIAYRLGVFGYLALPELAAESPNKTTGNYGLLDQIEALKWIYDNASCFGGDNTRITVAGESAGSSSVSAVCSTPLLRGSNVIARAIGESSSIVGEYPPHTFRPLKTAYEQGEKLKKEQGVSTLRDLRALSASKLVATKTTQTAMTLDGYALDMMPNDVYKLGLNNEKKLLHGYNVKEADAFVIPSFLFSPTDAGNIESRLAQYFDETTAKSIVTTYKSRIEKDAFSALNEIMSAYWFMYPHYQWSHLAAENGETVYRYQFTKENGYYGTFHSGEMVYCYGNLKRIEKDFAYNEADYALSEAMVSYWSNFAKSGDPNATGLTDWPAYVNGVEDVFELGENIGLIDENYLDLYAIFDTFVPKAYKA